MSWVDSGVVKTVFMLADWQLLFANRFEERLLHHSTQSILALRMRGGGGGGVIVVVADTAVVVFVAVNRVIVSKFQSLF